MTPGARFAATRWACCNRAVFTRASIQGYRGLDLDLPDLGRINLVVGRSGAGKSALLEGLLVASARAHAQILYTLASIRGFPSGLLGVDLVQLIDDFSTRGRDSVSARFTATFGSREIESEIVKLPGRVLPFSVGSSRTVSVATYQMITRESTTDGVHEYQNLAHVLADGTWFAEQSEAFDPRSWLRSTRRLSSHLELTRNWSRLDEATQSEVVDTLRELEPAIRNVSIVVGESPVPTLAVHHPAYGLRQPAFFGDAFAELVEYLLLAARTEGSTLLLDEFGAAFDARLVDLVIPRLIGYLRRRGIQLIASTHNLDLIDAVLEASTNEDELKVIQLGRDTDGSPRRKTLRREDALSLRDEFGLDLRRVA